MRKYPAFVRSAQFKTSRSPQLFWRSVLIALLLVGGPMSRADAESEPKNVRIAIQFGIGYLPILVAKEQRLL